MELAGKGEIVTKSGHYPELLCEEISKVYRSILESF